MTKLLAEERDALAKNQKDLEDGIESALRWVFCYYGGRDRAHEVAGEESTRTIGLLEVIDSDFSKHLTEIAAAEENVVVIFERQSKEKRG